MSMPPPYVSFSPVRDILSGSPAQGPFFFANENIPPMKQPPTTSIFNDIQWKCNASRQAVRENNFHIKPVGLREHGEQNRSFPEALISMSAIGNFADTFFICFCVHASLRMPAGQCHFEGKDKNFPGVRLFTLEALPLYLWAAFNSGSGLAHVMGRQRHAPALVLFRIASHPEPGVKEPLGPRICYRH